MNEIPINREQQLFLAALEISAEQRDAWLVEQCGADKSLLDDLRSLLRHDEPVSDPLEKRLDDALVDFPASGTATSDDLKQGQSRNHADSPEPTRARPMKIGAFEIETELGRGAMGVVYKAHDAKLQRHFALKVISPRLLRRSGRPNQTALERLRAEAKSIARLQHSNIVQVYQFHDDLPVEYPASSDTETGPSERRDCIAMQFVEGVSLNHILHALQAVNDGSAVDTDDEDMACTIVASFAGRHATDECETARPQQDTSVAVPVVRSAFSSTASWTRLTTEELTASVTNIGIQIADALAYAHRIGILHRDIKPGNILLQPDGHAWLFDFGLAERFTPDSEPRSEYIAGTLRYMAPEVFDGHAERRSDLYSLGATLYELLYGRVLLEAKSLAEYRHAARTGKQGKLSDFGSRFPGDLSAIIDKCTAVAVEERYADCDELVHDLRRFQDGQPVTARPRGAIERIGDTCRNHKLAALLVTMLLLVSLLFAIGQTFAARRESRLRIIADRQTKTAIRSQNDASRQRLSAISEKNKAVENYNLTLAKQTQLAQQVAKQHFENGEFAAAQQALAEVPVSKRSIDTLFLSRQLRSPAWQTFRLTWSSSQILDADLSRDGKRAVTIDGADNLAVWNLATLEREHELRTGVFDKQRRRFLHVLEIRQRAASEEKPQPARDSVTSVCFGATPSTVLAATLDGRVLRYSLNKDEAPAYKLVGEARCGSNDPLYVIARSLEGRRLFCGGESGAVYAVSDDNQPMTSKPIDQGNSPVLAMIATTGGVLYGTQSGRVVFLSSDGEQRFTREFGRPIRDLVSRPGNGPNIEVFVAAGRGIVNRLELEPGNAFVRDSVILIDRRADTRLSSGLAIRGQQLFVLDESADRIAIVDLDGDSVIPRTRRFKCGRGSRRQESILRACEESGLEIEPPFRRSGKLLASPTHPTLIAALKDSYIQGWCQKRAATKHMVRPLGTRLEPHSRIAFDPRSERFLWSISPGGELRLIDTRDDETTATRQAHESGRGIVGMPEAGCVATWGDREIRFWRKEGNGIEPAPELKPIPVSIPVMNAAVRPGGSQIAAVDEKGYLLVWRLPEGELLTKQLIHVEEGRPYSGLIAWNQNGSLLAALGPKDASPIYETRAFRPTRDHIGITGSRGTALCWSPTNAKRVCTSDRFWLQLKSVSTDGDITFAVRNITELTFRDAIITTTGDGRRFVMLTRNNELAFLDPESIDVHFKAGLGDVRYTVLASVSNANRLALVSEDGQLAVSRTATGDVAPDQTIEPVSWSGTVIEHFRNERIRFQPWRSIAIDQKGTIHGLFLRELDSKLGELFYYRQAESELLIEQIRAGDSRRNRNIDDSASLQLAGRQEVPVVLFRRRQPEKSAFEYEKFHARRVDGKWEYELLGDDPANDFVTPRAIFHDNGSLRDIFHWTWSTYDMVHTSRVDGKWESRSIGVSGDGYRLTSVVPAGPGKSVFGYWRYRYVFDGSLPRVGVWEDGRFHSVFDLGVKRLFAGDDGNLYAFVRKPTLEDAGNQPVWLCRFDGQAEQWERVRDVSKFPWSGNQHWVDPNGDFVLGELRPDRLSILFTRFHRDTPGRFELRAPGYVFDYQLRFDRTASPIVVAVVEDETRSGTKLMVGRLKE